CARKHGSLDVW
nr:immunoglobulin heavy chain junction region [Macaca mulatta]